MLPALREPPSRPERPRAEVELAERWRDFVKVPAIVTILALAEYMYIALLVGRARGTYKVPAPATTGDPIFERHFRVQQNTLEQLVIFLPALWIFALHAWWWLTLLVGLAFIVGRFLYLRGYVRDPAQRGIGFGISFLSNITLVVGALIGTIFGD
jgi:glutathione S-transferase